MLRPAGQHGIYNAQPFRFFDHDAYAANFTVRFLATGGARVDEAPGCDCSASAVPSYTLNGQLDFENSTANGRCTANDFKVCSSDCAAAWGIKTPENVECEVQ